MEIKGKVTHVLEPVTGTSEKGDWKKQTIVILEDKEQYPKSIAFDVFNDKVTAPNVGDSITAAINLDSREYNGKWYTNVNVWKLDIINSTTTVSEGNTVEVSSEPLETDDLPF